MNRNNFFQRSNTRKKFLSNLFFHNSLLTWVVVSNLPVAVLNYTNVQEQEVHVIELESLRSGESSELRLIHTNSGVFSNSDTFWWFKFNSSDVQSKLIQAKQSGKKVRIKTVGTRIPLFSQYPNILEIH
jgi:hypothetical protein